MYTISYTGYNTEGKAIFSSASDIKNKNITEAQIKTIVCTALEFITCFVRMDIRIEILPEKETVPEPNITPVSTNLVI